MFRYVLPGSLVAFILVACGSSSKSDAPVTVQDLPDSCNAYVAHLESCLGSLAPATRGLARVRAEQTRDALVAALPRSSYAELRSSCTENLSRMSSCGH